MFRMKLFIYLIFFLILPFVWTSRCLHRYHFWRPFFGEFTPNDFLAATDTLGRRTFVGKIIPRTERRSWTQPTGIMYDYTSFAWEDGRVRRTDRFMEIMAVEGVYLNRFQWLSVHSPIDLNHIHESCCLVEGGIAKYDGKIEITYIGRTSVNGSFFVGPVYLRNWVLTEGMHYIDGWQKKHRKNHYQVLCHIH